MRISDWSSDVCSSDLFRLFEPKGHSCSSRRTSRRNRYAPLQKRRRSCALSAQLCRGLTSCSREEPRPLRSEEHTSELQSLMRISYAVFCLKKKKKHKRNHNIIMYKYMNTNYS